MWEKGGVIPRTCISLDCMWEKQPVPIVHNHPRSRYLYASNFTLQTLYARGQGPLYLFDKKMYGPQKRPGHSSGTKEIPVPEEKQTKAIQPIARQVHNRVQFSLVGRVTLAAQ